MTLKRLLLLTVLIGTAVISLFIYTFLSSRHKIAYVDSGKLLSGYKSMIEARKEFEKKQAAWQSNLDTLTLDVQNAIKSYEKTAATGSDKEKQAAKEMINAKQKVLYEYQTAIKQNAGQEEQRLSQNVLKTVNSFLLRYGKSHGYKMILVAVNGNIAYADPEMDLSDEIIDQLNHEYSIPAK